MTMIEPLIQPSPLRNTAVAEPDIASDAGLSFHICQTLEEVTDAWQLLYRVYLRSGFVAPNPFEIHTTHHALGAHTAVIQTRIGQVPVGTIAAINDSPALLPLDTVYPVELAKLRSEGRKLIEVGLFGRVARHKKKFSDTEKQIFCGKVRVVSGQGREKVPLVTVADMGVIVAMPPPDF